MSGKRPCITLIIVLAATKGSRGKLDDRAAKLERLMREHSARVLSYAYHRGVSWAEAEDVVAEVFLVCWRRLDDVPPSPGPWILGVARKVPEPVKPNETIGVR